MKYGRGWMAGAAVALWLAAMGTTASVTPVRAQEAAGGADDPAQPLFARMCSQCHDSARIVEKRRTRADWEGVLTTMIEKGATGSEQEFETVFDFLVRHYGKAYVNSAKADELVQAIGLTRHDADAIVAYRASHGAFADFEAVEKVPEIDAAALAAHRDAVAF